MSRRPLPNRLIPLAAIVALALAVLASRGAVLPRNGVQGSAPGPTPQQTPALVAAVTPAATVAPTQPASIPTPTARATNLPTATAPAASSTPASARRPGSGHVLGYYVPYDATSWQTLRTQADNLDAVAAQWVTVDTCGNIGSRDDRTLVTFAHKKGIAVFPSLLTSSPWLNHLLLTDEPTTNRLVDQIVRYVVDEGYEGFDVDIEEVDPDDRSAYSDFVAKLSDALHGQGKLLTLAVPPKASDVRTGTAGAYDYAALGKYADLVLVMTYNYSWSTSAPGSVAPQDWVDRVAAYASSQMPPEKVLLGVAFYGYDWNVTSGSPARAVVYPQAAALATQYDATVTHDASSRSATFAYAANPGDPRPSAPTAPAFQHDISVRSLPQCGPVETPTPALETPRPTPTPSPTPSEPQEHEVWFEDASSLAGRLEIASRYGLAGVGAWRLGQEDPGVWPLLSAFRRHN